MFAGICATAERRRAETDIYLLDLNARLRCRSNRATRESAYSDITARLAARSMLSIYSVDTDTSVAGGDEHLTVMLEFDENAWTERRIDHGFVVHVCPCRAVSQCAGGGLSR